MQVNNINHCWQIMVLLKVLAVNVTDGDNSVAESFFSNLKGERVFWRNYQTRDESKNDLLNYILMFYNPQQFENNYWGVMAKAA